MKDQAHLSVCRSDFEIGKLLGKIEIDGYKGLTSLDAASLELDSGDADAKAHRAEMITAVRGGKHMELSVTAVTFRQRKTPNRRFLRLAADKLEARAPTWKGLPFLTDHNTYEMTASKGVISSSKLVQESTNVAAFEQGLHVVKPDAVIGFLDRTMNRFSVGWFRIGPVMCTVHGADVSARDGCGCWPGDIVMVDGKPQVVQYEFSDYEGKEVSAVVIPAVKDTSVSEVRAALAAELQIPERRKPAKETEEMAFPKLAAALALTVLTEAEEDRAVSAITQLRERASAAELDASTLRRDVTRLTGELAAQTALVTQAGASELNRLISDAYASGKLAHGKDAEGKNTPDPLEDILRDLGVTPTGREKLATKLTAMKPQIPIGQVPIVTQIADPARPALTSAPTDAEIASVASQLGIPVDDMRARYRLPPLSAGGSR